MGVDGRKGLKKRLSLFRLSLPADKKIAWFHVASLGEFEQGRPVIEAFKIKYPDIAIVITFFSPSGYEIRKNYAGADFICYLPIDTKSNSKWFIALLRPELVFFVKYEFWNNYLQALKRADIPVISFASIFREDQIYFKTYGGFFRKILACFDHLFVQNQASIALLKSIGINNASIGGDTRFDRVFDIVQQVQPRKELENFMDENPRLIAGSVWQQDMDVLIPVINKLVDQVKVIIAPHEIKQDQITAWQKQLTGKTICYSKMNEETLADAKVLIIDNVGMLSSLYQYGDMAYIGGSFGVGLHNTLEAATFGLPLLFGNKSYDRFQEAVDLLALGGAFAISNENDCFDKISEWLQYPEKRQEVGQRNAAFVSENIGATARIMEKVGEVLGVQ